MYIIKSDFHLLLWAIGIPIGTNCVPFFFTCFCVIIMKVKLSMDIPVEIMLLVDLSVEAKGSLLSLLKLPRSNLLGVSKKVLPFNQQWIKSLLLNF